MVLELGHTTTIVDAAKQLQIHPNSVRYFLDRGRLDAVVTPLGRVVVQESIDRLRVEREERQRQRQREAVVR